MFILTLFYLYKEIEGELSSPISSRLQAAPLNIVLTAPAILLKK
jgi:hypothetical protein